jgi:hypothetical protein
LVCLKAGSVSIGDLQQTNKVKLPFSGGFPSSPTEWLVELSGSLRVVNLPT